MRWLVPIAIILLLSACVQQPSTQPPGKQGVEDGELGNFGIQGEAPTGLETMPEYDAGEEDTSLLGEPMNLGSLI